MTEKLKPCPFCGGKTETKANRDGNIFQVVCLSCGAFTPWSTVAAELWNKRTRKDTSLKSCPICGKKGRVEGLHDGKFYVRCLHGCIATADYRYPEAAKTAWNARSDCNG